MRDGIAQIPSSVGAAAGSALGRLAAGLAGQSSDRERTLGLFLQTIAALAAAGSAWTSAHGDCSDDNSACRSALSQAIASATADSQHALVRLASSSSDPDAYALAMSWCRATDGESQIGDCALLSEAQWAKIEPDNAVPWLYLAAQAGQRHDRSALEAALTRASKSRYSDPHLDQLSGFVASAAFEAESPPVQIALAQMLIGIEAAFPLLYSQVLTEHCAAAQADTNVETCGDLAAMLMEHGRTGVDVAIGSKIADRIGWNDPRLSAMRDQADAIQWQMLQQMKSAQEGYLLTCDSLQRWRRNLSVQAQVGESGFLRRELTESGISNSQAAERWRAENRQRGLKQ